jgi:hypothetical protein
VSKPHARLALLLALGLLAGPATGLAANPAASTPSAAEIAAQRQGILDSILTTDPPYTIADIRWVCAMGQEPARVADSRAEGAYFTPDAADSCVAALARTAHDRRLPELYGKLLAGWGVGTNGSEGLPRAIGASVMDGNGKVAIGSNKVVVVTAALALDAGFAVGYRDGAAAKAPDADAGQLRTLAEACLGQHQDAGTCFSAGYVYGARAFKGQNLSAR